jgi:hypothetical protein
MAYKQTQGRSEFSKTGRGISSKLAGPGDPPSDLRTAKGLSKRYLNIGENLAKGRTTMKTAFAQAGRLKQIEDGKAVGPNYTLYAADSTDAANMKGKSSLMMYGKMQQDVAGAFKATAKKGNFPGLKNK